MRALLKRILSSDLDASSKRFIAIVLVAVKIVALFLLMYIKIEIANRDLVADIIENIFWLILAFGGFIAAEGITKIVKPKYDNRKPDSGSAETKAEG